MELVYVGLFRMVERGLEAVQENQDEKYLRLFKHVVQLILLVVQEEQLFGAEKGHNDLY